MKLHINAHAKDCFWVSVGGWEDEGYLPDFIAKALGYENGGDDLELEIDTETGQILNWDPSRFVFVQAFEVRITNALNIKQKYDDYVFENVLDYENFKEWIIGKEQFKDLLTPENYEKIKEYLETYEVSIESKLVFWETYKTILDNNIFRKALGDHMSKIGISELLKDVFSCHGCFSSANIQDACLEMIDYLKRLIKINDNIPKELFQEFIEYYFTKVNQRGDNERYPKILHFLYLEIPEMFEDFNNEYQPNMNNFRWLQEFISDKHDKSSKYFLQNAEFISYDMKFKSKVGCLNYDKKSTFENFLKSYNFLISFGDNKRALEKIEMVEEVPENAFKQMVDKYLEFDQKFKLHCSIEYSKLIKTLVENEIIKLNIEYIEQLYNKRREKYINFYEDKYQNTNLKIVDNILEKTLEKRLLKLLLS